MEIQVSPLLVTIYKRTVTMLKMFPLTCLENTQVRRVRSLDSLISTISLF